MVHLFNTRVHSWFDAMHVFTFAHACHMRVTRVSQARDMRVPLKLWVIRTLCLSCKVGYAHYKGLYGLFFMV